MTKFYPFVFLIALSVIVINPAFSEISVAVKNSGPAVSIDKSAALSSGNQKIYSLTVSSAQLKGKCNVLLFIDGVYAREFKNQTLPFSFDQNLSGFLNGEHEIRIDLEDPAGKALQSISNKINLE